MPKKRRKLDVVCPNKARTCFNQKGLKKVIRFGKKQSSPTLPERKEKYIEFTPL